MNIDIAVARVEKEIERKLSAAEHAAIKQVVDYLPADPRKRKRIVRIARERARDKELDWRRPTKFHEPTEEALEAAKDFLSKWMKRETFIAELERLARHVPRAKRFGNRYKFFREAIVLAEFCRRTPVLAVRLARKGEDPPDAWIRVKLDEDVPVEITEVPEPGHKPGAQIKKTGVVLDTYVPTERAAGRTEEIVKALEESVAVKANKYDFQPRLLVYLNFPHNEKSEPAIKDAIEGLKEKFADRLGHIHVITDRTLLI